MDCDPIRAQVWLDEHEGDLADLRVEDAVALVEGAGLLARVVPRSAGWSGEEQQADRVTLWLTPSGSVGASDAG